MDAYIHKRTGEILFLPDANNMGYAEPEDWGDKIKKVEDNRSDYVQIIRMSSRESYRVMETFIGKVDDEILKTRLSDAISGRGAFSRFRHLIDDSDYRQAWFDHRDAAQLAHTRETIEWKFRNEEKE